MAFNSSTLEVSEVSDKIKKISSTINEGQLASKGKYFGELYLKAGGYSQAIDWLTKYIRVSDRDPVALKLLGECNYKLNNYEKAIYFFKESWTVNSSQTDLLIRMIEMYLHPGRMQNKNKAEHWLGKVPKTMQSSSKIFDLKMELLELQEASKSIMERAILDEIVKRPREISLHIRYVKLLKSSDDRNDNAYQYCNKKENFQQQFELNEDPEWCSCVADIYEANGSNLQDVDNGFMISQLMVLEALSRSIDGYIWKGQYKQALDSFFMMDKSLFFLKEVCSSFGNWVIVHKEMQARLYSAAAMLIFHLASTGKVSSTDCINYCSVLYAVSSTISAVPTLTSAWAVSCQAAYPQLPARLRTGAAGRLSQCNHMLLLLAHKGGENFIDRIKDVTLLEKSGAAIYEIICQTHEKESEASFLYNSFKPKLDDVLPEISTMSDIDDVATSSKSLQLIIWLGIRWAEIDKSNNFLPWTSQVFPNLKMNDDLKRGVGKSLGLGVLDVEAFMAACVFTSFKKVEMWENTGSVLPLTKLPHLLCRRLYTDLQIKWWDVAKRVQIKSSLSALEIAKLKPILIRGIECIRGIGNHGLEVTLIVKLAKYFAAKARELQESSGITRAWFFYQERAALYWGLATSSLMDLSEGKQRLRATAKDMLFPHVFDDPNVEEAKQLLSSSYECQGELAEHEGHTDDALSLYAKASTPEASYRRAQLFKTLADETTKKGVGDYMVELNSKVEGLMKQHRNCLEMTMVRLQDKPNDNLHEQTIKLLVGLRTTPQQKDKSMNDSIKSPSPPVKPSTPKSNDKTSPFPAVANQEWIDQMVLLTTAVNKLQIEMGEMRKREERREMSLSQQQTPQRSLNQSQQTLEFSVNDPQQQQIRPAMLHQSTPNMHYHMQPQHMQQFAPEHLRYPPNPAFAAQHPGGYYHSPMGHQPQAAAPGGYGVSPYAGQPFQPQPQHAPPPNYAMTPPQQRIPQQFNQFQQVPVVGCGTPVGGFPNSPMSFHRQPTPQQQQAPPQPQQVIFTPQQTQPPPLQQQRSPNILADKLQGSGPDALKRRLNASLNFKSSPAPVQQQQQLLQPTMSENSSPDDASYVDDSNEYITCEDIAKYMSESDYKECESHFAGFQFKPQTPQPQQQQTQQIQQPSRPQPQPTPAPTAFLSRFKANLSGTTKFQSPEQMDRDNQELKKQEQEADDAEEETSFDQTSPNYQRSEPLPDIVEVPTGEENERLVFVERCKLFRWVVSEWKERGIGEMKVLVHRETGKSRLLMRREQVLKVCCNHFVSSSICLKPMPNNDKAMIWHAMDFADDEEKSEKFAVRFKTSEIATCFQQLVNDIANGGNPPDVSIVEPNLNVSTKNEDEASKQETADDNKVEVKTANKPVVEPITPSPPSSSKSAAESSSKPVIFSLKTEENKEQQDEGSEKPSMFAGLAAAFSKNFGGGTPTTFTFKSNFQTSTPTPASATSATLTAAAATTTATSGGDDEYVEEGPEIEVAENLPALVDVRSGEEDEQVMFDQRAKLFRYIDSQWKERGLGQMKILKHSIKGTYRILMRREQVMKPCANHYITEQLSLRSFGDKNSAWTWTAMDYADPEEPEGRQEIFAIRFKTSEIASQFKEEFEAARNNKPSKSATSSTDETADTKSPCDGLLRQLLSGTEGQQASTPKLSSLFQKTSQLVPAPSAAVPSSVASVTSTANADKPWSCPSCMVKNKASDMKCVCCTEANPNHPPAVREAPSSTNVAVAGSSTKFGAPSSSQFSFSAPTGKSGVTFGAPSSTSGTMFGAPVSKPGANFGAATSTSGTMFGAPSSTPGTMFGAPASKPGANFGAATSTSGTMFGAPSSTSGAVFGASGFNSLSGKQSQEVSFASLSAGNSLFNPTQSAPATFGQTSQKPSLFGSNSELQATASSIAAVAPTSSAPWSCPTCMVKNRGDQSNCPCCQTSNPNATKSLPAASKPSSGFSFQAPPSSSNQVSSSTLNQQPQVAANLFGSPNVGNSSSLFGTPPSAVTSSLFGSPVQGQDISSSTGQVAFGGGPAAFNPFAPTTGGQQQSGSRGVPTFDVSPDESSEDSEDTDNTSDCYSVGDEESDYNEEEISANSEKFRSPMLRDSNNSQQVTSSSQPIASAAKPKKKIKAPVKYVEVEENVEDDDSDDGSDEDDEDSDDVIYVGEELPSKELQKKAKDLLLPAHFYNYLGGSGSDEDESDEEFFPDTKKHVPKKPVFGAKSSMNMPSFSTLAARSESGFTFNFSHGYKNAGDMKNKSAAQLQQAVEVAKDAAEHNTSYDPEQEVPIEGKTDLPPAVEVDSGEENERVLFSERAKLFRWDNVSRQWKERGVGDIMIKHNVHLNRFRILMRREQVLKVCANHYISTGMKLEAQKESDKSWIWLANDYADGGAEAVVEKFAVRFKTVDQAMSFSEQFADCVVLAQDEVFDSDSMTTVSGQSSKVSLLCNKAEKMKNELKFFSDKFSEKGRVDLENTFTEGLETNSPMPHQSAGVCNVQNIALTPMVAKHFEDKQRKQQTGSPHSALEWDNYDLQSSQANASTPVSNAPHTTQSNIMSTPTLKTKPSSQNEQETTAADESNTATNATGEAAGDSSFIGEENDRLLFQMRVKLFLYDSEGKQWKDRGIGNVRLSQNSESHRPRLIMRREQVLKLCLNQYVSKGVDFRNFEDSQNAVKWYNRDFSDQEKPEGELATFAMRFKTPMFKDEFLKILQASRTAEEEGKLAEPSPYLVEQKAPEKQNLNVSSSSTGGGGETTTTSTTNKSPVKQQQETTTTNDEEVQQPVAPFSFKQLTAAAGGDISRAFKFGSFQFGDSHGNTPAKDETPKSFNFNSNMAKFDFGLDANKPEPSNSVTTSLVPSSGNEQQITNTPTQQQQRVPNTTSSIFGASSSTNIFGGSSTFSITPSTTAAPHPSAVQNTPFSYANVNSGDESSSDDDEDEYDEENEVGEVGGGEGAGGYFVPHQQPTFAGDGVDTVDESLDGDDAYDVMFVWEAVPTDDQRQRALDLQLPPTFFINVDAAEDPGDGLDELEEQILSHMRLRDDVRDWTPVQSSIQLAQIESGESCTSFTSEPNIIKSIEDDKPAVENKKEEEEKKSEISSTSVISGGLFGTQQPHESTGSFAKLASSATNWSFSAMAANDGAGKYAFGSRKDDAFNVTGQAAMMFTSQSKNDGDDDDDVSREQTWQAREDLPPIVETKTGEEEDEVIFKERAKLFRFDKPTSQWKERGIGDYKILFNPTYKVYRIVMRREQVLKVCANHIITSTMNLIANGEKAWMYVASDQSEGETEIEKLTVRFKTVDIAKQFHEEWERVQAKAAEIAASNPSN